MTEREKIERELILDILAESSKWRISEEDQNDDCIRLEVMDRARRLLLCTETVDANGYAQSHPDNLPAEEETLTTADYQALEAQHLEDYLEKKRAQNRKAKEKWKKDKTRVILNGSPVWKPLSECRRVPRWPDKPGTTGWKWEWVGPGGVDKLGDELWAEHEQSK